MNDTTAEFMMFYRKRIDALTDGERLLRGLRLFDDGKSLMRAGIRHDHPELTDMEVEQRLFLRMYGNELAPDLIERALARIARRFAAQEAES